MSYRIKEHHHHHGHRTMTDIATPMIVSVQNGSYSHLAIPCWYQEVKKPVRAKHHNRYWHHHVGWPSPNHPDHICQISYEGNCFGHKCPRGHDHCHKTCAHYIDMTNIIPIRLRNKERENYTAARVVFDEKPAGLTASAEIDQVDDWVTFNARCQKAIKEIVRCHFTVFIDSPGVESSRIDPKTGRTITKNLPARTDVVAHGILQILPSAYE